MNIKKFLVLFVFFIPMATNAFNLVIDNYDFDIQSYQNENIDGKKIYVALSNGEFIDFDIPSSGRAASYKIRLDDNVAVAHIAGLYKYAYAVDQANDKTLMSQFCPELLSLTAESTIHVFVTSQSPNELHGGIKAIIISKLAKDYEERTKDFKKITALSLIDDLIKKL